MPDIPFAANSSTRPARFASAVRTSFAAHSSRLIFAVILAVGIIAAPGAHADNEIRPGLLPTAPGRDILGQVEQAFDTASRGVSAGVARALAMFGEPNAYIIGGELSGSFVVGGRHGVGQLRFAEGIPIPVTWSSLSVGVGLGADYGRVIMLVYGLDRAENIYGTYASIGGSAHFLVGANATILASDRARIVLISSGLGLRLSGDLSRLRIEPSADNSPPRPPGNICASPADCPGRR